MSYISFFLFSYTTLFAIVDPPGVAGAFLAMTEGNSRADRLYMARVGATATGGILLFFTLGGKQFSPYWGFRTRPSRSERASSIILAALDMLRGQRVALRTSPEEHDAALAKADIAITPLSVPLLAGPGASRRRSS